MEPSSPAQVLSLHLTAHPGHHPPGFWGGRLEVSHDRRHAQLPRSPLRAAAFTLPWPASMCLGTTSCLPCWGLAGGVGLSNKHPLSAHPGALRFGDHLRSVAGADSGLTTSFLIGCSPSAQPVAQLRTSGSAPQPSYAQAAPSCSLLGSLSCLAQGHCIACSPRLSQAQPRWALRSPDHAPTGAVLPSTKLKYLWKPQPHHT